MYSEVRDSMGHAHILATQQKDMSCAIASCAMVMARVKGIRLEERALRSYSTVFDQGSYSSMPTEGYTDHGGTALHNVAIMLRKMCVPCEAKYYDDVMPVFKSASIKKPAIAHIQWAGSPGIPGGAHAIVVDGVYDNIRVLICDPWKDYGFREINNCPDYKPKGANGKFSGWLIAT